MVAATVSVELVLVLPSLLLLRRMSEHAGVIGGRRAGKRGPCAAQGLPREASVDTTARQPAVSTRESQRGSARHASGPIPFNLP
jgi:hypothetical protein